jgi:hypothetical protein
MKKNALVQLIVIYVGIMAMYAGLTTILGGIVFIVSNFFAKSNNHFYGERFLTAYIIVFVSGFIIIAKSGSISEFITEKANLDDALKIYTNPKQLLSILLVILAVGHLLDHLPDFVNDLLLFFSSGAPHRSGAEFTDADYSRPPQWIIDILHLLLPCLLIIFCRPLTEYFSKNIFLGEGSITVEHETINLETKDTI